MAGNLGHFVLLYALDVVVGQRPRVDPIPYWYDTLRYCPVARCPIERCDRRRRSVDPF